MKPFFEGKKAFSNPRFYRGLNGKLLIEANPYEEGTKKYQDWETGYNEAYFRQKEKVDARQQKNP